MPNLSPRGAYRSSYDQDPNNGGGYPDPDDGSVEATAENVLAVIKQALQMMDPGEAANLLAGLQDLVDSQNAPAAEAPSPVGAAMDRHVRRIAQDRGLAAKARQHEGFLDRHPYCAHIEVMGRR